MTTPYDEAGRLQSQRATLIDTIAEAMHIADEQVPEPEWSTLPNFMKTNYRQMAAIAYDIIARDAGSSHE